MRREERLSRILGEGLPPVFRAGFVDRVMARLATQATPQRPVVLFTANLQRHFVRLAPIAAALAIALGAYNLAGRNSASQSAVDAVLGLPSVTLAAAYTMDVAP